MAEIRPFEVNISQSELDELRLRLSLTRFPEKETVRDWSQGVPEDYLRELVEYWENHYDLRRVETRLNEYPQYLVEIDGLDIHFLHVRSPEPTARPVILTHGWPGSVVEFLDAIGPLTDPVAHGGNAEDAFHVVCPSLPGYGFSGKPVTTGWDAEKIASAWTRLMAQLGYERYFAQGGDWGSWVTTAIARQDPGHCAGIHLNLLNTPPSREQRQNLTDEEKDYVAGFEFYKNWDSGYMKQQSTRPQTIGYSLVDSPAGLLAWIVEKFYYWTDCDGHPEKALSRDGMLDNIMVYWLGASGASSARLYWEALNSPAAPADVEVPCGVTIFPKEIFRCSRRWAEKVYKNIVYWNQVDKGGHFAAFEQPALFVDELRACFREMG